MPRRSRPNTTDTVSTGAAHEQPKLHGILNGIDMDAFNPQTDTKIFKQYGPKTPRGQARQQDRAAEALRSGGRRGTRRSSASSPASSTRRALTSWKPFCRTSFRRCTPCRARHRRLEDEQMFIEAKRRWPDKVSASIMFSGDLANRIYAGADMFLMPSSSEPCGLAQMIACCATAIFRSSARPAASGTPSMPLSTTQARATASASQATMRTTCCT